MGTASSAVPRDAYEAAVARLLDEDLPVLAMLVEDEPVEAIADALRIEGAEAEWRAHGIVGRLRPQMRTRSEEQAVHAAEKVKG